jgi:RNA polymerase sigma factor (sigma-70 family)
LSDHDKTQRFNRMALQHMDAAYNLARWLTRNAQDADDVVQESFLKAFRHFDSFRGGDGRAWLLAIVRNASYTWLKSKHAGQLESFDEERDYGEQYESSANTLSPGRDDPQQRLLQQEQRALIDAAIKTLPFEFREVLVLREMENFSYKEIADIIGIPIGTVMSRLARARALTRSLLNPHFNPEATQ